MDAPSNQMTTQGRVSLKDKGIGLWAGVQQVKLKGKPSNNIFLSLFQNFLHFMLEVIYLPPLHWPRP